MHIVLLEPEIPPNTGNVARLCATTGTTLHLIEPFGFKLDDAQLKRAGMDYWQHVEWHRWANWTAFAMERTIGRPVADLYLVDLSSGARTRIRNEITVTADRLTDAIFDRFELLVEQPRMGRNRPEFGDGVRSFVVESYVIYYRYDEDLLIARVLHGRRDQAAAWSEPD